MHALFIIKFSHVILIMEPYAKIAASHYRVDKHDRNTAKSKIAKDVEDTGYRLVTLHRGVASFDNDDGDRVISIKGTNPTSIKDLQSDLALAIGQADGDKQFVERSKQVKQMLTDKPVTIVGHSLGGSVAVHLLTKDKAIRDGTKQAVLFNTGYTRPFHESLKDGLTRDVHTELKNKITHHHIKGDLISSALTNKSIGKVVEHDTDLSPHGIENFLDLN